MGAIDTLRDITRDRYDTEMTLIRCKTINEIADEIEDELNELRCKVEHVDWRLVASEILNKPADENIQSITEWLDKWYIPKPIGGDGNPISFDKLYDCGCGAIENINVFRCNGKYEYVVTSHDNISFFDVKDLHEQVPDSIEKLREDLCCHIHGCAIGAYEDCDACKDCEVTEWLARAEKLFGGDAE